MDVRPLAALMAAFLVFSAHAQTRTATGGGVPRVPTPKPAAYNPLSKSTTPFNCRQYRREDYPFDMRAYCQSIENSYIQSEAQRVGRPTPSASVAALPALGTSEAKRTGIACAGGTAMKRVTNGWGQLSAPDGGWQRCTER
jgi:hypothetical protein